MELRSEEEKQIFLWLLELKSEGVIDNIKYEPETLDITKPLSIKVEGLKNKTVEVNLIDIRKYTYDFSCDVLKPELFWKINNEVNKEVIPLVITNNKLYIDVKGLGKGKGINRSSDVTFHDRQYLMYLNYGIYVNEVVPHNNDISADTRARKIQNKSLFRRTFTPVKFAESQIYKIGVNKGKSKIKYPIIKVKDYLKKITNE